MSQRIVYEQPELIEWTSYAEESPASPTPSQESNWEPTTSEHSGRKCYELYATSGPLTWFWKTLLVSYPWRSTAFYLTWRPKATKQGRLYFQLVPKAHPIAATDCSLWRTPQAHNATQRPKSKDLYERCLETGQSSITLTDQVRHENGLWPTPASSDATRGDCESERNRNTPHLVSAVKMWPTPRASEGEHGGPNARDSSGKPALSSAVHLWPTPRAIYGEHPGMTDARHLTGAVQMWPTPQSRDYRSGDDPASQRAQRKRQEGWSVNLNDVALWPTPKSRDFRSASGDAGFHRDSPDLNVSVHMWSTPAAQDAKNATLPPSQGTRDTLPGDLIREGAKGQLNSAWVETLIGLPIGWTDTETPETEAERMRQPSPWPAFMGHPQYEWEPPRVAQGVKNRVARLKALGNAVVPAQAEPIFAAIAAHAREREEAPT